MSRIFLLKSFVILLLLAAIAKADTIGPTCGTCQGSTYTLTLTSFTSGAASDIAVVRYDIDTTGYTGLGKFIDAAAIKISSSVLSASLVSAPGGVGLWNLVPGGINADGCSGAGGGFECADYITASLGALVAGFGGQVPLSWTFQLTIPKNSLMTGANASSIKARYIDASGAKVGALVSEGITLGQPPPPPVSEPAGLVLMGLGLIGAAVSLRRKL